MDGNNEQAHEQVERPLGTRWHEKLRPAFGGIAIPTNAGRQRGRNEWMNAKRGAAGVALLCMIVAGLAGLRGEAGGAPRTAHADAPVPTVTMSTTYGDPLSAEASGTGFTPGGAVHIDLVLAYWQPDPAPTRDPADPNLSPIPVPTLSPYNEGAPQIVASADTWAARPRNVPNGHGLVFHRTGGYFDETLASLTPNCGGFSYWLVATDEATGVTSTSAKLWTTAGCS